MRKFLRCLAIPFLIGASFVAHAKGQDLGTSSQPWKPAPITSGVVVKIDGRDFVVSATIQRYPQFWIMEIPDVALSVAVSIHAVNGGFLPATVRPWSATLLSGNRQVWRGGLYPSIYYRSSVWLPPGGYGQYQAVIGPTLRENSTLTARVEIRTLRGTLKVDVPVVVPRPVFYPIAPVEGEQG